MAQAVPDRRNLRDSYAALPLPGRIGVAAVLGALASLGQAPFDQPLVMLVFLSVAFLLFQGQTRARDAALTGWVFGMGYFGVSLSWIVEPFQIDSERYAWMAPFALAFISIGLALFWAGAFWSARILSSRTWPLVLTWTAAEMLRAYVFTGFPWASPPQALVAGIAGQGLAYAGPHGMMLCLMSLAWVFSITAGQANRYLVWTAQALMFCGVAVLLHQSPTAPAAQLTPHWVRLIQPNAAQDLKWQPDFAQDFFGRQLELTRAQPGPGTPRPDLTVWPETAIPWTLETAGPALEQIAAAAQGNAVVLGVLRRERGALFNALTVLDATGLPTQIYDKYHLVPFGEYIPFGGLLTRFGITGLAQTSEIGFAAGSGPELLDFGMLGRGLPLICYEAVFAHGVNSAPKRPDFMLQITNDAWFGQLAGPQQHLAQARMRAIEQGLPLMRSANTGISAMIDPQGRILASLPMNTAGFVDAQLPAAANETPYSRAGDAPVAILLAIGLLLAGSRRRFAR